MSVREVSEAIESANQASRTLLILEFIGIIDIFVLLYVAFRSA